MRALFALLIFAVSVSLTAQTADVIYKQACGPKEATFTVELVKGQPPAKPEPGKALVYFIQNETGTGFTTRVGLDGAWVGVVQYDSYIFASVAPGEHHACAATLNRRHLEAELIHFTVEAGKTYYYLVRGIAGGPGGPGAMEFGPPDSDEALALIASDPQTVSKPEK
jgi:hypothetical protein